MHELIAEILSYLQGATRYKWWGIGVAWVVCLGGWVFVSQMPDQYQATARVHVDTRSVLTPLLSGLTIQPDVAGQVLLMSKLMFSRPNLEKLARMTDLDLAAKDEKAMEGVVARLSSSLAISGGQNNLFSISANDRDPKLAKKMVQSLLTVFVEQTLGESREDSSSAQRFLEQQLKEYESRLQAAEKAREDFKRANYGLMPGQGGDLYAQLQTLSQQLEEAKLAHQEAINRRDEMKRQIEDESQTFSEFEEDVSGEVESPLDARIQALQLRLDELGLKYTREHPEVVAIRKTIKELEKQKRDEQAAPMAPVEDAVSLASTPRGAESNPIYQQMKIALSEADASVASLNARVSSYEEKIENAKKQMDARLRVETELQNLNRDYGTIKEKYDSLLARRETARLSENIEQNTDSVKFRVVDPPQVPSKPSAPNRILFSSIVLIGGLVIGVALTVFLAILRPAFSTTQKVRDITGLPILGTVSMNWLPDVRTRKWREFLWFCGLFSGLVMCYLAVVLLEFKGINLRSIKWS